MERLTRAFSSNGARLILEALARATGADYLLSGDQHLTELADPRPAVLTPRALLDQLEMLP